jgi:N-acetyl-anhydromuramyl-L-alanine amidase AmpD
VPYPFVESPNITRSPGRSVRTVVIHTMEIAERDDAARACAAWFASPAAQVSAHYCVDRGSIVQCVREEDVAWHARGGNATSIGVELAGAAAQTPEQWADAYSAAVLRRAAGLVAALCVRHDIPVRRVAASGLRAGASGITGHADVSLAFGKSDHWDPGPGFPWDAFLRRVRAAQRRAGAPLGPGERRASGAGADGP